MGNEAVGLLSCQLCQRLSRWFETLRGGLLQQCHSPRFVLRHSLPPSVHNPQVVLRLCMPLRCGRLQESQCPRDILWHSLPGGVHRPQVALCPSMPLCRCPCPHPGRLLVSLSPAELSPLLE